MKKDAADNMAGRSKYLILACITVVALAASGGALAREITVGGGLSAGYEFEDRQYDDEKNTTDQEQQQTLVIVKDNRDERYSRLRLTPLVTLTSTAERDEIALRYSPSFWQDIETSDNDVDQNLEASLSRYLARHWQAKLTNRYKLTDEIESRYGTTPESRPATTADTAITESTTTTLSDSDNNRRYWTNDLSLSSEYEYQLDCMLTLAYRYNILENLSTNRDRYYEDFNRHELLSELSHRFGPVWRISAFGSYVRGLFDNPGAYIIQEDGNLVEDNKDLNEYRAATKLQADVLDHHAQTLEYSYYYADYDAPQNADAAIHDVTLGWRWDISKEAMFSLGAGPTYTKTEGADGEWVYNGNTSFSYAFERGLVELKARRGNEILNFTGNDESGLRKFWQSRLRLDYLLHEKFTTSLYADYRYEDEETVATIPPVVTTVGTIPPVVTVSENAADEAGATVEKGTINRKRFSTGIGLAYTFQQWYKLSLAYDYIRQDSEQIDDSFHDHRVALTLSYETDFFKW